MTTPTNTVTELQKISPSQIIELYEIHLDQRLHFADWEASKAYTLGETVSSTNLILDNSFPPQGMVFECTTAGTSGSSLPNFPTTAGNTVTDNNLVWTAKRPIKRFHAGVNQKTSSTIYDKAIHFNGKVYEPFPIMVEGYEESTDGSIPRPLLTISNLDPSLANTWSIADGGSSLPGGTITSMMLEVNKITVGNDLIGSTFVRIKTLGKFLDSNNFNTTNPNADPTQICSTDIHMISRKTLENREIVQFECASNFDMAGIKAPKRQILPNEFPGIGEFFQ